MKKKDIFQLALLRIKSKNSIRTFAAMLFGLIMLVEVLWLAFAINLHMQSQLNDTPISNLFLIESNAIQDIDMRVQESDRNFNVNKGIQLTYDQKQSLPTKDEVVWTEFMYDVSQNKYSSAQLEFSIDGQRQDIDDNFKIKFIKDAQTKTHPDSIEKHMLSNFGHGVIYGGKFGESKRELYISETMLDRLGITCDEAIGKNVSMSMVCGGEDFSRSYLFDNDTVFENQHIKCYDNDAQLPGVEGSVSIFADYRIVGVISREYYSVNKLTASDCDIWLKDNVLTAEDGESLFPKISVQEVYGKYSDKSAKAVLTYPNLDFVEYSQSVTEQGRFFPFFAGGLKYADINMGRGSSNNVMPTLVSYVQCEDFKRAKSLAQKVREYIIVNSGGTAPHYNYSHCSNEFAELWNISDTMNKVSLAFAVIGGLTLLTVILNYANVVSFNARKRESFLKMMKKIGMTEKDKNTLVNMEIFGGYTIVLIIAFVVGLVLSAITKAVIIKIFSRLTLLSSINIALWLYFPAFLIVALIMFLVMVLIALNGKTKKSNTNC